MNDGGGGSGGDDGAYKQAKENKNTPSNGKIKAKVNGRLSSFSIVSRNVDFAHT